MPGSSAGLNRVYATLLTLNTGSTAIAGGAPGALTAYGTIGVNDSGMALNEAMGFTKWSFSGAGGGTGYSVSLYGTTDPVARGAWIQGQNPGMYPGGVATLPASSWFLLPGPSEQSGTGGSIANPLTGSNPYFQYSGALIAVRAVLTGAVALAGSFKVTVQAIP